MTGLDTIDLEPKGPASSAIIWLHGLGADAHDFEPIVGELRLPSQVAPRFVFPNAPQRPVTVNGGYVMRAWYDIFGLEMAQTEDEAGIRASEQALRELIEREKRRGIPSECIVLAGFSQGGAVALQTGLRYPEPLAGILALSCYLPLAASLAEEGHSANRNTSILMAHGDYDPVVPMRLGLWSKEKLRGLGYAPEWREYSMAHEVCWEEISDISDWLGQVLTREAL